MKICSRCKASKPETKFNYKNRAQNILQRSCKICTRQQIKAHYDKNRSYYLVKARTRNKKQREAIKKFIWNYLQTHPCVDCGEKDPIVLDFDHQRDKIAPVSAIIKGNYPIKTIEKEIAKCVVRCANCHRRKTAKDFDWYKHKYAPVA